MREGSGLGHGRANQAYLPEPSIPGLGAQRNGECCGSMTDRPDWDHYFMQIAQVVEKRGTCVRPGRKVGAVLTADRRIIATGYNGVASGLPHCTPETCQRTVLNIPSGERMELCRAIHAEINCSAGGSAWSGQRLHLYVTAYPCSARMRALYQAGVVRWSRPAVSGAGYDDFGERMIIERR